MLIRPSHAALAALAALSTSAPTIRAAVPTWFSHLAEHAPNSRSQDTPAPQLPDTHRRSQRAGRDPEVSLFEDIFDALRVLQDEYYEPWLGCWPKAIDWTMAVTGTHVTGALQSLSRGLAMYYPQRSAGYLVKENLVNTYFSHLIAFYFGQNSLSLRNQAYDDMLWVVLGWLDTVRFIGEYGREHFPTTTTPLGASASIEQPPIPIVLQNLSWHGNVWTQPFGHRARVFWDLASQGWDDELCGGGMTWNPRLMPYKNAITNQLFISASMSMYLDFPGDSNPSPFLGLLGSSMAGEQVGKPQDPKYLAAAVKGYNWLRDSHMQNHQGLFVDGFHISGLEDRNASSKKCDQRNEAVYTYNQGVILSGLRSLFTVTGAMSFLDDGHKLIQSAINATGWDLAKDMPVDVVENYKPGTLPPFRGLGRAGVLEDWQDAVGSNNQDGQTFKGIFMHHFAAFCAPLEPQPFRPRGTWDTAEAPHMTEGLHLQLASLKDLAGVQAAHANTCLRYTHWLRHNARAAWETRDEKGRFGGWWTAGILPGVNVTNLVFAHDSLPHVAGAVDYRNDGVPDDPIWTGRRGGSRTQASARKWPNVGADAHDIAQKPLGRATGGGVRASSAADDSWSSRDDKVLGPSDDPNERGRGRTVETQGSGLAVLRALWELLQQRP